MQPNDVGIVAKVVADAIQKATKPLLQEIEALKARQPERGEKGADGQPGASGPQGPEGPAGKDATVDLVALAVEAASLIPTPKDGQPGEPGQKGDPGPEGAAGKDAVVDIEELATKAAALIPKPQDGAKGQDGAAGRDGIDGKDADPVTPELVLEALSASPDLIRKAVELHLTANPPAPGKDGADGIRGKDGSAGLDGKDGPEGKPGRDGQPGVPGRDGDRGKDGADGIDGLGFDDIQVEHDGERAFSLKFVRGNREKSFGSFTIPSLIYRGVYQQGSTYATGDCVTWGGSLFVAQTGTKAKPETNTDWKLAVKRGRDGQDVKK